MIITKVKGKVSLIKEYRKSKIFKGRCRICKAEYTCSKEDLLRKTLLELWVTDMGMIECTSKTCKNWVTVKTN